MTMEVWPVMVLLLASALLLWRAVRGASPFDRILAGNALGTVVVALLAVIGWMMEEPVYLDIALIYVFVNFLTTMVFMKYYRKEKI